MKTAIQASMSIAFTYAAFGWAVHYARHKTSTAPSGTYESAWDWQIFFFCITRLPILMGVLALSLWAVERRFSRRNGTAHPLR